VAFLNSQACAFSIFPQFLPGPHLTMTMADHGAGVIMVEPKCTGEPVRVGTRGRTCRFWFAISRAASAPSR
jgi:crotonobetainyl-CoA:carnitine CoA-transferase CaiB-like acyl-CoA transferase